MNELTKFNFDTMAVRVVVRDGFPWFVAADLCAALGILRTDDGVSRLDDDEKDAGSIRTPGGEQQMTIVNESGLYSLILGSRKPEAKRFKKWVTAEVLPAIRKTGSYSMAAQPAAPALPNFADPVAAARAWADAVEQKLLEHSARVAAEHARDEAVRTKALIGSKREATAMATASAAAREAEALRKKLGACTEHATVLAVEKAMKSRFDWRPLRRWCAENSQLAEEVHDDRYGTVKSWPAAAWRAVFGVDLPGLFGAQPHAA